MNRKETVAIVIVSGIFTFFSFYFTLETMGERYVEDGEKFGAFLGFATMAWMFSYFVRVLTLMKDKEK